MRPINLLTQALVIIGGINWLLVALAEFDLVAAVVGLSFGETSALSRIVYGAVGIAALYQAVRLVGARTHAGEPVRVTA